MLQVYFKRLKCIEVGISTAEYCVKIMKDAFVTVILMNSLQILLNNVVFPNNQAMTEYSSLPLVHRLSIFLLICHGSKTESGYKLLDKQK